MSATELGDASNCPFLESIKPTITSVKTEETHHLHHHQEEKKGATVQFDSTQQTSSPFEYDNFFHSQILKKKKDHSYRIFKKVARFADQPPFAHNYADAVKDVTVWCSNDYLGMTANPKVRRAVQ